jgi:hypothetical protein
VVVTAREYPGSALTAMVDTVMDLTHANARLRGVIKSWYHAVGKDVPVDSALHIKRYNASSASELLSGIQETEKNNSHEPGISYPNSKKRVWVQLKQYLFLWGAY